MSGSMEAANNENGAFPAAGAQSLMPGPRERAVAPRYGKKIDETNIIMAHHSMVVFGMACKNERARSEANVV